MSVLDLETLKDIVDRYQTTRNARLAMEKQAEKIKDREKELANTILSALRDAKSPVVGGTTHQVTRKVTNEPTVEDWDLFYEHIHENKAWDLLHRRVASAAVKLRWDENEEIPGVGSFPVEKLSITKLPEGA